MFFATWNWPMQSAALYWKNFTMQLDCSCRNMMNFCNQILHTGLGFRVWCYNTRTTTQFHITCRTYVSWTTFEVIVSCPNLDQALEFYCGEFFIINKKKLEKTCNFKLFFFQGQIWYFSQKIKSKIKLKMWPAVITGYTDVLFLFFLFFQFCDVIKVTIIH
jgi:hypothetical protein